ncbi:hypothetical protein EV715DRAFT_214278 [Schizophyllum commune]
MPPTGGPVKIPTYDDELMLLEGARHIAFTYEGNPRNYEDAWYPFWSQFFRIWTFHIHCRCLPSAQYSVYTKTTADVNKVLRQIVFGKSSSASSPTQHNTDDPNSGSNLPWKQSWPVDGVHLGVPQPRKLSAKAQGKQPEQPIEPEDQVEPEAPANGSATSTTSSAQQTEPGRDTTQRVPDTCLVMYHIPKLTPETARKLMAERLKGARQTDDQPSSAGPSQASGSPHDADPSRNAPTSSASQVGPLQPPGNASMRVQLNYWVDRTNVENAPEDLTQDPIGNAMPAYRAIGLHKGITQFKSVIAEHKGGASRSELPPAKYEAAQTATMREGQSGSANQGRLYLMHCQHYSSQTEVLLIASVNDTWTHSILHRVDDESGKFKVQMDPWSAPVIVGSDNSNARETKLLAWINERFPQDLGPLVRESQARRREATPDSHAGGDPDEDVTRTKRSGKGRAARGTKGRRGVDGDSAANDVGHRGGRASAKSGPRYNLRKRPGTSTPTDELSPRAPASTPPDGRYNLRKRPNTPKPAQEPSESTPAIEPPRAKRRRTAASTEPSTRRKPGGSVRGGRPSKQSESRATRSTARAAKGKTA